MRSRGVWGEVRVYECFGTGRRELRELREFESRMPIVGVLRERELTVKRTTTLIRERRDTIKCTITLIRGFESDDESFENDDESFENESDSLERVSEI
jgi:hypothetical protein